MLQISYIRQNAALVKEKLALKNFASISLVDELIVLDEELRKQKTIAETSRLQENPSGLDLPDLQYNPAQLCPLVRHLAHLLLRVRGAPLGHRPPRGALHRVRSQVPREVQGPAQRGLPST